MCVFTVFSFFVLWTKLWRVGRLVSAPYMSIAKHQYLVIRPITLSAVKPHTRLTGVFNHKHPTPSPITWQGMGIHHHVCMYNQFMAPHVPKLFCRHSYRPHTKSVVLSHTEY